MKKVLFALTGILVVAVIAAVIILSRTPSIPSLDSGGEIASAPSDNTYTYTGNIAVKYKQNCTSIGTYSVKKFHVQEGDYVHKGDLLYDLDDSDVIGTVAQAQAGVAAAQTNYEKASTSGQDQARTATQTALQIAATTFDEASKNLIRTQTLFDNGAVSQSALDSANLAYSNAKTQLDAAQANSGTTELASAQGIQAAKAALDQARGAYQSAEAALEKRRVTADIDGTVADIYPYENSTLTLGQKIMDIVDYNSMILEIKVDQFEVSNFEVNQTLQVYINALDRTVDGTISKVSNQAVMSGDIASFIVTIDITYDPDVKIGLMAEVRK